MYQAEFWVKLRLPDNMTTEQAKRELETSISFGKPEVRLHYVLTKEDEEAARGHRV